MSSDALLRKLNEHIEAEDHDEAAAVARKLLKVLPDDTDALQCLITALILESKFADALAVFPTLSDALRAKLLFEEAYCLYRQNSLDDALKLIESVPQKQKTGGLLHLEAQAQYRAGNYAKSMVIYQKYFSDMSDHETVTNTLSALVLGNFPGKAISLSHRATAETTYEMEYNTACALIDDRQYHAAQLKLASAKKLCAASMADDDEYTEEERRDELAVILVQDAYVLQMMSPPQTQSAKIIYQDTLKRKPLPSDPAVVAVCCTNLISLRRPDEKLFDSAKKAARAGAVPEHKLSPRQRGAIQLNRCLLQMLSKQSGGDSTAVQQVVGELKESLSADSEFPTLALAALHHREGQEDACVAVLQQHITANPNNCTQCSLTLAQIYIRNGMTDAAVAEAADSSGSSSGAGDAMLTQAVDILCAVTPLQHQPATVATLLSLCVRIGDLKRAVSIVQAAVAHWETTEKALSKDKDATKLQKSTAAKTRALMLERAAEFYFAQRLYTDARTAYERLRKADPDNNVYAAMLVACCAESPEAGDLDAAVAQAASLPPMPGLSGVDVEQLLSSSMPSMRKSRRAKEKDAKDQGGKKAAKGKGKTTMDVDGDAAAATPAKKRKKRKKILPKGFDPANPGPPPDPERWLPAYERAGAKKRRKRGGGRGKDMKGAQGGAVAADELDAAHSQTAKTPASTTPTAGNKGFGEKKQMSHAKKKQKKKKKKGGF